MSRPRAGASRVFSVPAGARFIETLAAAFLNGVLFDRSAPLSPEEIANATIYLPTRRAVQALTAALGAGAGRPLLLPNIQPLGDFGTEAAAPHASPLQPDRLQAIAPLDRRLALFRLVDDWRLDIGARRAASGQGEPFYVAQSRADAFALAGDLAALIDEAIIEDIPLSTLAKGIPDGFDPARHDVYWSLTSAFTAIAAERWPEVLAALGRADAADMAKRTLREEARRLSETATSHPVVIAGSTGSVTATAELMRTVAGLPLGAVVLPGLDQVLPDPVWALIGAEKSDLPTRYAHPQGMLKRTLGIIGVARNEVRPLGPASEDRARLVSETFRPAEATEGWAPAPGDKAERAAAPQGLLLIEAADTREEALAIALVLREALETPGRTAALVTPDRQLARSVQNELERWGVDVADSAGTPLTQTPMGVLARLALRAAAVDAGGAEMLALLRHPLALADCAPEALDALEIAGLRGRRLRDGAAGLAAVLRDIAVTASSSHRDPAPRRRLTPDSLEAATVLAGRLEAALTPLGLCLAGNPSLRDAAAAHQRAIEALAGPLASGAPDSEVLLGLFDEIVRAEVAGPLLATSDYAMIFEDLARDVTLPPPPARHSRVKIWGLLEARLLDADRIVLAGLNEGSWPPETRGDPFLNRPMRIAIGLQPPERRIGQTAHDFQMLLGHDDVVLTRALKRGSAPAVASRFLRRLTAWLGAARTGVLKQRGRPYLDWVRAIDTPDAIRPVPRPAPRVAPELLPARLALTEIETLYRDPYAIFARRILNLEPLEPIDPPLDARERGTLMHQGLGDYVREFQQVVPPQALAELLRIGREAFAPIRAEDAVAAEFWWRRFEAFAPVFIAWDNARRKGLKQLHVEEAGSLDLDLPGGHALTLHARADRIESLSDGTLAIIDYKTGTAPGLKEVAEGYAPQLPLTAALAARGAFRALSPAPTSELMHVLVAGRNGEGGPKPLNPERIGPLAELAEKQFLQLREVLTQFAAGTRGFNSRSRPKNTAYAGDFDLLARHLEWSLGGAPSGEEDEP